MTEQPATEIARHFNWLEDQEWNRDLREEVDLGFSSHGKRESETTAHFA